MVTRRRNSARTEFQDLTVNSRIKISALWTAMMFVFAYVDIFSFFRADIRADIEAGQVYVFEIGEGFLLGVTIYVLVPTLMVFASLVMRAARARMVNVVLAGVYALTIVGGAVGEWGYYVLGSAVEVALLAGIVYYSVTWPREVSDTRSDQLASAQLVG